MTPLYKVPGIGSIKIIIANTLDNKIILFTKTMWQEVLLQQFSRAWD